MAGLRILLTNWTMADRHGSVMYLRDLALGLLRQGQRPVVYTPDPGPVADELRAATVPVVADLAQVGEPPDVVHGHSHPDFVAALTRFPAAPGVFVCHAWDAWLAEPPRLPRVIRYVAVDETCRDWLVCQRGVPAGRAAVLLNAVDLRRFRPRPPLPGRPGRALMFSNYAAEHNYLRAVRQACDRAGVRLDVIGSGVGNACDRPEEVLGEYDLVFAKARCAQEAMAVGAAVVLCDEAGCGPMVTAAEFGRLRRLNFGRRALDRPVTAESLAAEIARYDPASAAEVSGRMRQEARLDDAVAAHVALCREVLREHAATAPAGPEAEPEALAAYLQHLDPARNVSALHRSLQLARTVRAQHEEAFYAEMDRQNCENAAVRRELAWERDASREEAARLQEAVARLRVELEQREAAARDEAERLRRVADELRAELDAVRRSASVRWATRMRKVPFVRRCLRALTAVW